MNFHAVYLYFLYILYNFNFILCFSTFAKFKDRNRSHFSIWRFPFLHGECLWLLFSRPRNTGQVWPKNRKMFAFQRGWNVSLYERNAWALLTRGFLEKKERKKKERIKWTKTSNSRSWACSQRRLRSTTVRSFLRSVKRRRNITGTRWWPLRAPRT